MVVFPLAFQWRFGYSFRRCYFQSGVVRYRRLSHRLRSGVFWRILPPRIPAVYFGKGLHINALELLTVVIAIKLWSLKLTGLSVELLSDNTTCVAVINSQYSTNVFMQRCLRELWLQLALFNIQLVVRSVRGSDNWLADSLSTFHVGEVSTKLHSWCSNPQLSQRHVDDSLFEFAVV